MGGGKGGSNRRHVVGGGVVETACGRRSMPGEDIVRGLGEMVTHLWLDF